MNLAESLKRFRNEFKVTQQEVSDSAGINVTTYRRYECGLRAPAYEQLLKLADTYNVSLDYLVGRSSNPAITP